MRASQQEQTGTAGSSEVTARFEKIHWGVAENSRHDLGTDLFLMARDERLFDLGLMVGAQVKTGPSYFKERILDPDTDELLGWWFRESTHAHFNAWLAHHLPHLVILHDLESSESYWAHVTLENVNFLPVGAKIFVPKANTIDAANIDPLLAVAASKSRASSWEGSAWSGVQDVAPRDQLRHALLVPRLVAPHGNLGHKIDLSAAQAIALLIQGRDRDLAEIVKDNETTPDLKNLAPDAPWAWLFASAMSTFLRSGDPDSLRGVATSAVGLDEKAASVAAYAAALLEDNRAADAAVLLKSAIEADDLEVVDHAWMMLQNARANRELGRVDEARKLATDIVEMGSHAPTDLTATAIAGAATSLVFSMADWGDGDLAKAIAATDNTIAWWRQQSISWGLGAQTEAAFKQWSRDTSVTFGGTDKTWRHLREAMLTSGLLGDQAAWRRSSSQLAKYILLNPEYSAVPVVSMALTVLRRAGDHAALKLALRRVISNGPYAAAKAAVEEVDISTSSTTSVNADLVMITEAGAFLSPMGAMNHARWAMDVLIDPTGFEQRFSPGFVTRAVVVESLAQVIEALATSDLRIVAEFFIDRPPELDDHVANKIARLIGRMPRSIWTKSLAQRAATRPSEQQWSLRYAFLGIAATASKPIREALIEEASTGSLPALDALGDVTQLDMASTTRIIASLGEKVESMLSDAASGKFGLGGHDVGRALAMLNVWHPDVADWESLLSLLESTSFGDHIDGALHILTYKPESISDEWHDRVLAAAHRIAGFPDAPIRFIPSADPRPNARRLVTVMERLAGRTTPDQWAALARGGVDDKCAAAALGRDPDDPATLGMLLALVGDPEPQVRASVATSLTIRAARGDRDALECAVGMLDDEGALVSIAIANILAEEPALFENGQFHRLIEHPSAKVRLALRNE